MPVQQPGTFTVGNQPTMGKRRGSGRCVIKLRGQYPDLRYTTDQANGHQTIGISIQFCEVVRK